MMMNVKQALAALAAVDTDIADNASAQTRQAAAIMREQERLAALKRGAVTLNEERYHAQRAVGAAEEADLLQINLECAERILTLHTEDPIANIDEINAGLAWLNRAVQQSPMDNRIGSKQPTLIHQAMKLQPPRDDMNTPVYQLGAIIEGKTDWPSRRKALLAEHETLKTPIAA